MESRPDHVVTELHLVGLEVVDMLFNGWSLIMLGLAAKKLASGAAP